MKNIKIEADPKYKEVTATIDTEAFLKATTEKDDILTNAYHAWLDLDDSIYDCIESFESFCSEKLMGGELKTSDNVYNHENDFSDIFQYAVWSTKEEDWMYGDENETLIYISIHQGGDARGNYGAGYITRLTSESFLDWNVGWHVSTPDGDEALHDKYDQFSPGYSSNPTHELNKEIEEIIESNEDSALIKLKDGETVRVWPATYVEGME